ncbi:MAG: efflux RND transporter periplasmic adaptor subunit [Fimbriiglobus sp.]|jgi:multidrug efflux pump subunit AcrA (membrane-fusion protein)|nr:efflux RND transporter periplasmic adaptor subunit [Fimbriiglobus sp.]
MQPINSDSVEQTPALSPRPVKASGFVRGLRIVLVVGLAVGGIGVAVGVVTGVLPNPLDHSPKHAHATPSREHVTPTAKVIRPKPAAAVPITVEQLALVEPYYRADLRARASGLVKAVRFDIGSRVKKGEVLVEIDVPELEQGVAAAVAVVAQREQELKVSQAKLKDAKAAVQVSAATIKQREADVQAATATRDLKQRRFERFKALAARGDVVGSLVEEEERDYLASEAGVTSAKANVERARADFTESESRVEAAEADIGLKSAQIEVATKDLDRARAVADYARVVAPFDGVVVRRTVDPGSFVQNATTGMSEPLISLARVDLVTVAARFPDAYAPLVMADTPAIVQVDDLPGLTITAKVTRFAPSVQNADRTMRVEVDLFNGDEAEFRRSITAGPLETKGVNEPPPLRAFPEGHTSGRLLPGMTGTLRLSVGGYGKSFVLPSTAVYTRAGASYLLLVENGTTRQVPVRVQVNDGRTVRVAMVSKQPAADGSTRDLLTELTGDEQVVAARQLELGDGTAVTVAPTEW